MTELRGNSELENRLMNLYRAEIAWAADDLLSAPVVRGRRSSANPIRAAVSAISTLSVAAALVLALSFGLGAAPGVGTGNDPSGGSSTTSAGTDTTPGTVATSPSIRAGTPIDIAALPPEANCDERLRSELDAAVAIRASLRVDGLASARDDAIAAAADPTTTLGEIGIPITAAERSRLSRNGLYVSPDLPLTEWVYEGAPERFGGIWRDPSNPSEWVVSIVNSDRDTIGLARCVASLTDVSVRYVVASISDRDGEALVKRISGDMKRLHDTEKIPVSMLDFDEVANEVVIGVDKPTQAMIDRLHDLYGADVHVVDQPATFPV
jgi:hypothetical protein